MPVYCVTGTNRGLGLEFVKQLAQVPGNTVIATARPDADLADLKAVASDSTHILECDTSSVRSIHLFANKASRVLDGQKIDFLLNNAGIGGPTSGNSLSLEPTYFAKQISVNVVGPAKVVEFLLDHHVLAPNVRILNMSSGLGSLEISNTMDTREYAGYSMSKAAVNMLTVHQGSDIRAHLPSAVVISMDPGWVKTRMGGDDAQIEPAESISGMLKVLHAVKDEDNASFWGYDGAKRPW